MLDKYLKWKDIIQESIYNFLVNQDLELEKMEAEQKQKRLNLYKRVARARGLDIVRAFIPTGNETNVRLQNSLREVKNVIRKFREDNNALSNKLADQLFHLLNLSEYQESGDIQMRTGGALMKHTETRFTYSKAVNNIKNVSENDSRFQSIVTFQTIIEPHDIKVELINKNVFDTYGKEIVFSYLKTIFPNANYESLIQYVQGCDDSILEEYGTVIFADHTDHNPMNNVADLRGMLLEIEADVARIRDLNRHRANGVSVDIIHSKDVRGILLNGFNSSEQMMRAAYIKQYKEAFNEDLMEVYKRILDLYDNVKNKYGDAMCDEFIYTLLPLAHQSKILFSGSISSMLYTFGLRIKEGGDMVYRIISELALKELYTDPVFRGILKGHEVPDPENVRQLISRN